MYLTDYLNNIMVMKLGMTSWVLRVARIEEMRNASIVLVGKPERKRPRGRHGWTKENNIKINFKKQDTKHWNGFIGLKIGESEVGT
jgi:hypothetical protein